MKKQEFFIRVRTLSNPEDYEKNKHLLDVIQSMYYDDFLNCLKSGTKIYPSFKALDKLIELSRKTALGTDHVLELVSDFRMLIAILDFKDVS
jgi:hypothetical protein